MFCFANCEDDTIRHAVTIIVIKDSFSGARRRSGPSIETSEINF